MKKTTLLKGRLIVILVYLFFSALGFSQSQTFTTSGSFTVPAGVTTIQVEAWGAGGAGGGATGTNSAGGGGAGGGYAKNTALNVTPGTSYTVTVGTGGVGNTTAGQAGGSSWFGTTGTFLAVGGNGGNLASAANTTATGATGPATGNAGWSGSFNYYGGNGGTGVAAGVSGGGGGASAGTGSNGNAAVSVTGGIAVTGGTAGANGSTSGAAGASGNNPGSGGAGGRTSNTTDWAGGSGGRGQIIITWVCPTYSLTSTSAVTPICTSNTGSVTLLSAAANLPAGSYTVTYNLSGANSATGSTASMTVTTAGTGTFTTSALALSGTTTVTITKLSSGGTAPNNCSSTISTNNTTNITVNAIPAQPGTITGSTTPCIGSSLVYSVTNLAGVTYNWVFPSGWTQTAGGTSNSVTVTVGSSSGNVQVTPSNSCGTGTARTLAVTTMTIPSTPSSITGSAAPCVAASLVYSVTNVAGTTYTWAFPSGWNQTAGGTTNSVTVTVGATSGNITVTPSNACGAGTAQALAVTTSPVPAQPSAITGSTAVCQGVSLNYSVTNVAGVTYNWTFPSGWTQTAGTTTNSITVTTGSASGNITVTPSNACGNGTARVLAVTATAMPTITSTTPGSRTGVGAVNLAATASAGTISWYAYGTGGTALGTGTTFTTPDIVTSTTFYIETTNGSCTSTPRTAILATINAPEIAVSGNGYNIADEDITPETTDYTNLGTTNVLIPLTRTYTIQNTGTINLTIGAFTFGGTNASEFVLTTTPSATLIPGASTTFSIKFTPTAVGPRSATISFVTNDADENPFNFYIAGTGGTGVTPEINVQGSGVTIIDGDSGPTTADGTDFGTATIGTPITKTFTIQNLGTGPLTLSGSPIVVLTGSSNFTVQTQPSSTTIAAGASLTFQVKFNPSTTGSSVALISINNSDGDESVYDFVIQGAAVVSGREIDIQGNEVSIADGDTTPNVADQTDFGITDTTTQIAIPFNVYSFGTSSLTLTTAVSITGTNASSFTATALPNSLSSGAVTTFVITFTPSTVGVKTATITVTSNDTDEGSYNFDIKAEVQTATSLTNGPGGITSNLKLWLKANSKIGSLSDSDAVTTWEDQTIGSTKSAISKFLKEPKFYNNSSDNVNFNPVVRFNGSNTLSATQGFYNQDMFIVIRPTNTITFSTNAQDIFCGDDVTTNKNSQDVTGFQMGNTSSRHTNEILAYNQGANTAYGIAEINTTKSYSGVNIFNPRKNTTGRMDILCNGATLTTVEYLSNPTPPNTYTPYKDIVNSRYWIGRSEFFDASYAGDVLEIVNYGTKNSDADKNKIESYLAIKYGITLGTNGTSQNYVDSSGNIIYPASSGFNYNIAGIGRDDKSQLNQKQSKTENTSSDITMGLANIYSRNSDNTNTFVNDKDFLVWGSNNGTLGAQAAIQVNMSAGISGLSTLVDFTSVGRTWKVMESGGDVATVKVSIPSTMLTSTITPPGDFLMFISSSPIFSPTAEYRIMKFNGSSLETYYNFDGTKYITFGYAPERTYERSITFNGIDDYMDAGNVLDLDNNFTVSAWVKRSAADQSIVSKRDNAFTSGYDFKINSGGFAEMSWFDASNTKQTITSDIIIPAEKWHNLAVTFNGTSALLYIDGVLDMTLALNAPGSNSESFLIAAADGTDTTSFFKGTIDEIRVWGVALSAGQLRYVMNQELLKHTDNSTNGSIIPQGITLNEVKSIPWSNLKAYYPMSTYTYTNAKDKSNNDYTAAIKNLTTVDYQTAPLPYVSAADGNWTTAATWKNNDVQDLPYSLSIVDGTRITWNIVNISHKVTSTGNKTVLGMQLLSNTLAADNDTKVEISHYLKLNGKIDLIGKSQLVQSLGSDLDVTSSGSIERDQQGTKNIYNYNYWASPVGGLSTTANNSGYSLSNTFKDGTDPDNLKTIAWTGGYNGSASSPISLASYWIFKFQNVGNDYANWTSIGSSGTLQAGEGFTLKGSGAATDTQNYTFTGKPNNASITLPIGPGFLNLTGNPYPSALDSEKFILDNLDSLDGTLYFWEHYSTNNTHNLADYQGGYAALTIVGGTPPVSPPTVSGSGSSSRIPNRFIPVGQGFFVTGNGTGGQVKFSNAQRLFVKENSTASNIMFRSSNQTATVPVETNGENNNNDQVSEESGNGFKKIRIGFNSTNNYHRQLLMGFMNQYATSDIDAGYDAFLFDDFPSDMYFLNGESKLVIQGEGYFNQVNVYPLGVKSAETGNVQFILDALEGFSPEQDVYIYDSQTDIYHDIKGGIFEIALPAGLYENRFSLRFANSTLGTGNTTQENGLSIIFTNNDNLLSIKNPTLKTTVNTVTLFNILGQNLQTWDVADQTQEMIQIPVKNYSAGTYIVKLQTTNGTVSKKIVIK